MSDGFNERLNKVTISGGKAAIGDRDNQAIAAAFNFGSVSEKTFNSQLGQNCFFTSYDVGAQVYKQALVPGLGYLPAIFLTLFRHKIGNHLTFKP